jgi:raffinose/stachyose/melibiose transport system substrate-binding protein
MNERGMRVRSWVLVFLLAIISLLSSCERSQETAPSHAATANLHSNVPSMGAKTILRVSSVGEISADAVGEINRIFEEQNPGVTIQYDSEPADLYESSIKTRLSSGDAPDVFFVWTGAKKDVFAKLGYLMDLSNESWVSRVMEGPKKLSSYEGKVYSLPLEQAPIAVMYNRTIFHDLGIAIPQNWLEFMQACQILQNHKVMPIVLGNRDLWVSQLINYAMAPSAIYRDVPNFDERMFAGKATFVGSGWEQMMRDYAQLEKNNYFNQDYSQTTYDQAVQLLSSEKAAMMVMASWAIEPIRQTNPTIDLGMFPLPYTSPGGKVLVSLGVNSSLAISSETKQSELAKSYLRHWASAEMNRLYLGYTKSLPTLSDVHPQIDSAMKELLPYMDKGTYTFLDQKWPPGVQEMMFAGIQRVLLEQGSDAAIQNMLGSMDKAFKEGINKD